MSKKMKGTTAACLKDYAAKLPPKGARNSMEARRPLAEFAGVNVDTTTRWTFHGTLPQGETILRLRLFLQALGYEVIELSGLAPVFYSLVEILAFRVLSLEEVRVALGYKKPQDVYQLAHGWQDAMEDRKVRIMALATEHKAKIEEGREALRLLVLKDQSFTKDSASSAPVPRHVEEVKEVPHQSGKVLPLGKDQSIQLLAHLILAAAPLAKWLASNECTEDDRRTLREYSENFVFPLSNHLTQLCGEKARDISLSRQDRS